MVIFKSIRFSFTPYSSLTPVEGGWLKMPPKRKFREFLQTAHQRRKSTADKNRSKMNTTCPKVFFLYFRTVAKCKAEQTSSERRRSVRRGTGQNPKSRYEHY